MKGMELGVYTTYNTVTKQYSPSVFLAHSRDEAFVRCREVVIQQHIDHPEWDYTIDETIMEEIGLFDTGTGDIQTIEQESRWTVTMAWFVEDYEKRKNNGANVETQEG